jgi:hypothetical protein
MTQVGSAARPLAVRGLVADSFRLLKDHFGVLFVLALAPALIEEAVFLATMPSAPPDAAPEITSGLVFAAVASGIVSQIVVALVVLASIDAVVGRSRRLGAYVGVVMANLLPLLVLGTLLSIAAGIAALFFLIPGIYVYAQFLVWLPALLIERKGMGALSRAQALTRGHRWSLVGGLLLLLMAFLAAILLLGPLLAQVPTLAGGVVAALIASAVSAFSYAIIGIFVALVFLRLRFLEDATPAENIAASF